MTAFRTVMVVLDRGASCSARVALAAKLARQHDAHLIGLAALERGAIDGDLYSTADELRDSVEKLHSDAQQIAAEFERQVAALGVASFERRIDELDATSAAIANARCADLAIVGQADRQQSDRSLPFDLPEHLVLQAGRPVLVVPYAGTFKTIAERPLVAWDGSGPAARALQDAIPMLRNKVTVRIVAFNLERLPRPHALPARAEIARWLARHGVSAEVKLEHCEIDVGNALVSRAADWGADLLVMGAYGHARMREAMLGGVTRSILEQMTLPVLMAH